MTNLEKMRKLLRGQAEGATKGVRILSMSDGRLHIGTDDGKRVILCRFPRRHILDDGLFYLNCNPKTIIELLDALDAAEREQDEANERAEAAEAKFLAILAHDTCGCSYDKPDDLCLHHSPKLLEAVKRAEAAERERDDALAALSVTKADLDAENDWGKYADNIGADLFDKAADRWLEMTGIANMHNAVSSVFSRWADDALMDRFKQHMTNIMHQSFVEGAIVGRRASGQTDEQAKKAEAERDEARKLARPQLCLACGSLSNTGGCDCAKMGVPENRQAVDYIDWQRREIDRLHAKLDKAERGRADL